MPSAKLPRRLRERFDAEFEQVLAELPPQVLELFDQLALVVEDAPSRGSIRAHQLDHPDELCGQFVGSPRLAVDHTSDLPDTVFVYRRGVLALVDSLEPDDYWREVRRQIRITILHEVGHFLDLDEDDLDALGYG